jgi:hypothetical protein
MVDSTDVIAGTNGTASQYNNLRSDVILGKKQLGTDADAATVTLDLSLKTKGNIRSITLGANRTLAISNPTAGQAFAVILKQDGTGSRTVTWWANILWPGATIPTLTTTANRYDMFTFLYDGTNYLCIGITQNLG